MTDRQLLALYHERMARLAKATESNEPIGSLPLDKRDAIDMHSALFRRADKAIARELRSRGGVAELEGVTLHLTRDGQSFVALEPGTERPVGWEEGYVKGYGIRSLLYRGSIPSVS